MAMIADWIVDAARNADARQTSLHVAIVGSAFGLEVREALLRMDAGERNWLKITLLDLDPSAVDFGRHQLAPLVANERLTTASANLFRLPNRPQTTALLDGTDLLFCPGLFDYLDDNMAADMLRSLYERLSCGGRMGVFQFAPHDSTRAYMEWVANWYLTYRDPSAFRSIVELGGLSDAQPQFGSESQGIDLFVWLTRC
jgi:hypothetical protein